MKLTEEMKGLLALHDEHACRLIYSKYKVLVEFICAGAADSLEDVHEITKIVFCKVFQDVQNYGTGSDLSPWIARIAYRVCRDYKNNREKFKLDELDESLLPENKDHYSIQDFLQSELYQLLDERERDFVFLHIIHGLTYREISCVFGMNIKDVKNKMKEIELKLEEYIKQGVKQ